MIAIRTALYDAIYRACKDRLLKDKSDRPIRRAIIIVSDGEDNQSEYSRAQAIEMVSSNADASIQPLVEWLAIGSFAGRSGSLLTNDSPGAGESATMI